MTAARIKVYELKVSLVDAKPPIWRRLLIGSATPLPLVHCTLQVAMGWTSSHLHQFIADRETYGTPNPEVDFDEIHDEARCSLGSLLKREKDSMLYEYDFGDGWRHKITLEKIQLMDSATPLPQCLKGKGACPPEDVGGIWGYQQPLERIADPQNPEREELLEWAGGEFDPNALDIEAINEALLEECR